MKKHFSTIALVLSLFCFAGTIVRPVIIETYAKIQAISGADTDLIIVDNSGGVMTTNGVFRVSFAGAFSFLRNDSVTWYVGETGDAFFPSLIVDTTAAMGDTTVGSLSAAGSITAVGGGSQIDSLSLTGTPTLPLYSKADRDLLSATDGLFIGQTDNTPGPRWYHDGHWWKVAETTDD